MSNYIGSVPETKRKADWRDASACRDEDPEMFFPSGTDVGWKKVEAQARSICFRCPVRPACLEFALTEGIRDGIYGGLTEQERTTLRRRATRKKTDAVVDVEPPAPKPTSLRAIWNAHARAFAGGHIIWQGSDRIYFKGASYTPRRISFVLDRGRNPEGRVTQTCDISSCINPSHLIDETERTRCGTRPGYQKHLREGTEVCTPCRQANADADSRLRLTGSTKELAA